MSLYREGRIFPAQDSWKGQKDEGQKRRREWKQRKSQRAGAGKFRDIFTGDSSPLFNAEDFEGLRRISGKRYLHNLPG